MNAPEFKLEKVANQNGTGVPTLVKYHADGTREEWGNVDDFDRLFNACSNRWGTNWNLEKTCIAILESEID